MSDESLAFSSCTYVHIARERVGTQKERKNLLNHPNVSYQLHARSAFHPQIKASVDVNVLACMRTMHERSFVPFSPQSDLGRESLTKETVRTLYTRPCVCRTADGASHFRAIHFIHVRSSGASRPNTYGRKHALQRFRKNTLCKLL